MPVGEALSYSYKIPLNQQPQFSQQDDPQQQQQSQYEMPEVDDHPLANRGKKTSDLYSNYGLLKSFITSMSKQGIDPTVPDYSQDGGGPAFQTYLKLEAGVRYAANALKREAESEDKIATLRAQGKVRMKKGVDTSDLYYSNPDNFYSTDIDPRVQEANKRTAQNVYTQQDANRVNQAVYDPTMQAIEQSGFSPEEQQYQQSALLKSVPETAYQQLIPRGGGRGPSQQDLAGRAELIKSIKKGIITDDQTPLNILRQASGVEGAQYVHTGDEQGIEVFLKGQAEPEFIDLSRGGEGEINSFLNKIEGQKNIPNEHVFNFDTKVDLPKSNVGEVINGVKDKIASFQDDAASSKEVISKLQPLAKQGALQTEDGKEITSIELKEPWLWGSNTIVVTFHPDKKNGRGPDRNRTQTMEISDPADIKALIDHNAHEIAPEFGGGFENSSPAQKAQDLIKKYSQ